MEWRQRSSTPTLAFLQKLFTPRMSPFAIARHEPDSLQRVAGILENEGVNLPGEPSPGAAVRVLAQAWLGFTGHHQRTVPEPPARTFSFAFPATMTFDMVGTGTPKSARRRALRALRVLADQDVPLGAVSGPLPANPELLNVIVWAGSSEQDGGEDRLHLELATDDEDAAR